MNFPTLPYNNVTYSFLLEIWFWGPTHPTFLYDVTLFSLFFLKASLSEILWKRMDPIMYFMYFAYVAITIIIFMACFCICAGYRKCNSCPCVKNTETEIRISCGICQCKVYNNEINYWNFKRGTKLFCRVLGLQRLLSPPAHVLSSSPHSQVSIEWWNLSVGWFWPNWWLFLEDKVKTRKSENCSNVFVSDRQQTSRMLIIHLLFCTKADFFLNDTLFFK